MTGSTDKPLSIAVLASGRGSNLQALLTACKHGHANIRIQQVASNRADARALRLAEEHGIPTLALDPSTCADRAAYDHKLLGHIAESDPDLLVLAGFMRVLDGDAIAPWQGRMINIHPSLLPKYRGLHTHQRVLDAGDVEHGASVHFVTAELDGGPIIAQARIPVLPDDTADSLAARLLPQEHRLLTAVVAAIAEHRLQCSNDGVQLDNQTLAQPLQLAAQGFGFDSSSAWHTGSP